MEASLGFLGQAGLQDPLQRGRNLDGRVHGGDLLLQDRAEDFHAGGALEGAFAGEHLPQDHAQAEQVAAAIHHLPADLLGAHVGGGAHEEAILGLQLAGDAGGGLLDVAALGGGDAEVEDLDVPQFGDEKVVRLEVPVNDALVVGRGQAVGHRRRDFGGLAPGQAAPAQPVSEGLPGEELHDQVGVSVLLPRVEDLHQVRVGQGGEDAGLPLETPEALHVLGEATGQDLHGHIPVQVGVVGPVDVTHTPGSDQAENFIVAQIETRREGHGSDRIYRVRHFTGYQMISGFIIYLANLLGFFWFDVICGVAVGIGLPMLLLELLP